MSPKDSTRIAQSESYKRLSETVVSLLKTLPDYQKLDNDEQRIVNAVCATTDMKPESWASMTPKERKPWLATTLAILMTPVATPAVLWDMCERCLECLSTPRGFFRWKEWMPFDLLRLDGVRPAPASLDVVIYYLWDIAREGWSNAWKSDGVDYANPPPKPTLVATEILSREAEIEGRAAIALLMRWLMATFPNMLPDNAKAAKVHDGEELKGSVPEM